MVLRLKFSKDLFDEVHCVSCYGDLETLTLVNKTVQSCFYVSSVSFFDDKPKESLKTEDLPF